MWRKVLQIYKKKLITLIFAVLLFNVLLFCQTVQMPSMPSMPQMPSISSDGSFYTPSFPSRMQNQNKTKDSNSDLQNSSETVIKNQTTNSVSSLLSGVNGSSMLTTSDISSLYDSGLFGNVSSLYDFYGTNLTGAKSSELQNYTSNYTSNILLQQILTELEQLKNEQKNNSAAQNQELSDVKTDAQNFKKREPSVLRFKINGYDIKGTLTETFFSDTEPDGTFLFTADRKYFADNKPYKETFYMLFTAENSKGSTVFYNVEPRIVQETKNENSYVYKFLNKKNITAEKTGNLVVLHFSDEKIEADILLDIDKR